MAEFAEVIRQVKRMCEEDKKMCAGCPMLKKATCIFQRLPEEYDVEEMRQAERIIMDWAAQNPEPRYPTWEEWQKANFPNALHSICPNYFMREKPLGTCAVSCAKCTGTPIPADIAEKLGIKPIGGARDENA